MVEAKRPNQEAKKQTDHNADISKMDTIYRQAAIDALGERPMVWAESDYELGARNQYDADVLALETVPPAQPEIIRCKDCKYGSPNGRYGCTVYHYKKYDTHNMEPDDFCSRAERMEE